MTTATVVTLDLPLPPHELHPNARVYWATRSSAKVKYQRDVSFLVRSQVAAQFLHPVLPLKAPVTAQATFVYGIRRKRDEDNAGASLKAMWDTLVTIGLLEADDAEHLHVLPVVFEVVPKAKPSLRVRLEASE